jgi:hypothetical protein
MRSRAAVSIRLAPLEIRPDRNVCKLCGASIAASEKLFSSMSVSGPSYVDHLLSMIGRSNTVSRPRSRRSLLPRR